MNTSFDPSTISLNFKGKNEIVNSLTDWPLALVGAAIGIGFLTMTIIEMIKVNRRRKFHERKVSSWLTIDEKELRNAYYKEYFPKPNSDVKALNDLVLLSTGGHAQAFCSLSVENLCGQIIVAVQTALESPINYPLLLFALLGREGRLKEEIIKDYLTLVKPDKYIQEEKENKILSQFPSQTESSELDRYMIARNRIATHIQRNVDSLQITITFEWKKIMRRNAFFYSFFISITGCILFSNEVPLSTRLISIFFFTYIGAFFASLLRDLLSLIEKNKK